MSDQEVFNSFDEAREYYKIPDDRLYLKIIDHPRSMNQILLRGKIVHYIGSGIKLYPGYPGGNQLYAAQLPIIQHFGRYNTIYMFRKLIDGRVICMGKYMFQNMTKKIALTGFTYYDLRFYRKEDIQYIRE